MSFDIDPAVYTPDTPLAPIRAGFGRGLLAAGHHDDRVVALCADLTESTQMHLFRDAFPERFIEVGVAEQNLVTVAAGMARAGKVPFTSSYAAFSPGRNWEQIKTTAALNEQPVKIVGSHAGLNVGPDGATHQMLEDIALMRVMPHMVVIAPGDHLEAERATVAIARDERPAYLRLARDATPVFSRPDSPFEIGRAYRLVEGDQVSVFTTGTMTYHGLMAARQLSEAGVRVELVHCPTIKPLDADTLIQSAAKTGLVITVEEAQAAGGFGGAVTELLAEHCPTRAQRLGVQDRYGQSGKPAELLEKYGLTAPAIVTAVQTLLADRVPA